MNGVTSSDNISVLVNTMACLEGLGLHTLSLVRKTDIDAIFRNAAADVEKVTLDKISWLMPHVIQMLKSFPFT